MHPLLHALIRLAVIYALVYAVCFTMEGATNDLPYGIYITVVLFGEPFAIMELIASVKR